MKKILLKLGVALPVLSMFLWAGLDIRWWAELEQGGAREFTLLFIHLLTPAICAVSLLNLEGM